MVHFHLQIEIFLCFFFYLVFSIKQHVTSRYPHQNIMMHIRANVVLPFAKNEPVIEAFVNRPTLAERF